ncbi:MAG: serine/threonine protein kinase, partial [Bdellovibrionales bacterium]|nr:serine/threonine protein kinase [Bdellovibrionales bacterium]
MTLNSSSMSENREIQTIGKYKILGTLGRGSMGIVYKGQDPEIGRLVAIKTLRKMFSSHFQDTSTSLERFRLEARSAGNLRHPNIITVFDINFEGEIPFIVMDYVEGEGLDQLISKNGRIEPRLVIRYLREVAQGLDYAHSNGVIHRDIKPSNIIV